MLSLIYLDLKQKSFYLLYVVLYVFCFHFTFFWIQYFYDFILSPVLVLFFILYIFGWLVSLGGKAKNLLSMALLSPWHHLYKLKSCGYKRDIPFVYLVIILCCLSGCLKVYSTFLTYYSLPSSDIQYYILYNPFTRVYLHLTPPSLCTTIFIHFYFTYIINHILCHYFYLSLNSQLYFKDI